MNIRIEELVQKGQGLGHMEDGKVVFVSGALPGELVEVQIMQSKKDYITGKAISIIESSPDRCAPQCPLYGICGGCNLMHLKHSAQKELKKKIFLDTLQKFQLLDKGSSFQMEKTVSGTEFGYRSRVRFEVQGTDVGFFQSGTHDFVPTAQCPVLDPSISRLLSQGDLIGSASQGKVSVCLGDAGPIIGKRQGELTVKGHRFPMSNDVFFQSNVSLLPEMIDCICTNVVGTNVMDLYSGIGTFSAFLEDEHDVIAVEKDPNCLKQARKHLHSTQLFTDSVENFKFSNWADTVIVDPPRVGLDRKVPFLLGRLKPSRIIYTSCDSVTFARDATMLKKQGYALKSSRIFDFYPQTSHMESVNILERRTGK
ncbi:MAG: TRAM domain-containing protein [Sphaerochaetaceae bacterium]|jgi:23S rRNA (uracil1939-C5)-methyltransferase|nr:TRAM domain-containing protein [Sphaerochaetaceae bacterium]NLY06689.1 class I SAM-dependent RNA methyltransferase [Spirochaetales bacterium]